jgi:hypothetical protein
MNKVMAVSLFVLVALGSADLALAAQRGTPEYEALKEYKRKKKAEKEAAKAAESADPGVKEKSFWEKEAERSGFAGTGAMFARGVDSVNPFKGLDQPREKASG